MFSGKWCRRNRCREKGEESRRVKSQTRVSALAEKNETLFIAMTSLKSFAFQFLWWNFDVNNMKLLDAFSADWEPLSTFDHFIWREIGWFSKKFSCVTSKLDPGGLRPRPEACDPILNLWLCWFQCVCVVKKSLAPQECVAGSKL